MGDTRNGLCWKYGRIFADQNRGFVCKNSSSNGIIEKIAGSLSVAFLILIVNKNEKWFSLSNRKERLFFILALVMLAINFGGWIAYYNGYQTYALMLICLVGAVPLYYMFLGLWRKNYPLVIISILFLIVHVAHVALNLSL